MNVLYAELRELAHAGRLRCEKQEKQAAFETVCKLARLAQGVRKNGLLWLDEVAADEKDVFLRCCLRQITEGDGTPEAFREYAVIWLLTASAEKNGARLLEMVVIADGLELMLRQADLMPRALLRRLGAWLGADYADEIEAELTAMERRSAEQAWAARMAQETSADPGFDALADLPDAALCLVLDSADAHTLVLALQGASGAVLRRVETVAPARWTEVKAAQMLEHPRSCDVQWAQQQLLAILDGA